MALYDKYREIGYIHTLNRPRNISAGLLGGNYSTKILNTSPANLIGYWPLWEVDGTNADNLEGTAARDGTYTGVSLNDTLFSNGDPVGLWDGSNDYLDIYSTGGTGLADVFDGAEGTVAVWFKVSGAGVWTDGVARYITRLRVDANNFVDLIKWSSNNTLVMRRNAGGTTDQVLPTESGTDWIHLALTWSEAGNVLRAYVAGAQSGADQGTLGTWVGDLAITTTTIGAAITTPTNVFDGWLAHYALWDTPLSAAQIANLAII
jgi:hypothetical protein